MRSIWLFSFHGHTVLPFLLLVVRYIHLLHAYSALTQCIREALPEVPGHEAIDQRVDAAEIVDECNAHNSQSSTC